MIMAQNEERNKLDELERWDQAVFKPNRLPTPSYFEHETFAQQQKRLMEKTRHLVSEELQNVRKDDMFGSALNHVAKQHFEEARSEALRPTKVPEGELRETVSYDQSGRPQYSYWGSPRVWMDHLSAPKKQLVGINTPGLSFQKV
jgi:hypothetical protein